ncbi:hypothetical protein [Nocardia sp. NPDC051832]|uniref:hypothetical protein n=1 Tax=Nocardia sp. NPDC051832 TaxID=3155673 RepID=UPI0034401CF5
MNAVEIVLMVAVSVGFGAMFLLGMKSFAESVFPALRKGRPRERGGWRSGRFGSGDEGGSDSGSDSGASDGGGAGSSGCGGGGGDGGGGSS